MTYKQLLKELQKFDKEQLETQIKVVCEEERKEYYAELVFPVEGSSVNFHQPRMRIENEVFKL